MRRRRRVFLAIMAGGISRSRVRNLVAISVAAGGAAIAWFAPVSELEAVRVWFIGSAGGPFRHELAHRVTAFLGALLGGLVLWRILSLHPSQLVRLPRAWLGGVAFALLIVLNVRWVGVALGLWPSWWPWVGWLYLPAHAALALYMLVAAAKPSLTTNGLALALGAGVAYGAFSTLWHCCFPLWETPYGRGALHAVLAAVVTSIGALSFVGFVGAAPARWQWPGSGVLGAVLLGTGYVWHTPAFFVQCLLGGALAVWMVQTSGNPIAGGAFLAAAFETHLVLPYIGIWGALVPLAFLLWLGVDTLMRDDAQQGRSRASRVR